MTTEQETTEVLAWLNGLRENALKVNDVGYGPEGKPLADRCTRAIQLIERLRASLGASDAQQPLQKHIVDENTEAHRALDRLNAPKTKLVPTRDGMRKQEITMGLAERIAKLRAVGAPPAQPPEEP